LGKIADIFDVHVIPSFRIQESGVADSGAQMWECTDLHFNCYNIQKRAVTLYHGAVIVIVKSGHRSSADALSKHMAGSE